MADGDDGLVGSSVCSVLSSDSQTELSSLTPRLCLDCTTFSEWDDDAAFAQRLRRERRLLILMRRLLSLEEVAALVVVVVASSEWLFPCP